jgi:hypothetical protein
LPPVTSNEFMLVSVDDIVKENRKSNFGNRKWYSFKI